jgi:hypothetical protein
MVRLLADENFNNDILRGLRRRNPEIDIVRVQDVGLARADDPTVLAWAAAEGRIVVTHDRRTLATFAYDRVRAGLPMPGVIEVSRYLPIGQAIEELLLLVVATRDDEWDGQVRYLPL